LKIFEFQNRVPALYDVKRNKKALSVLNVTGFNLNFFLIKTTPATANTQSGIDTTFFIDFNCKMKLPFKKK
jgi:hypothetical protein